MTRVLGTCHFRTDECLCMLICIFDRVTLSDMNKELEPGNHSIGEEDVAQSAPMVRALVVQRLEMIWRNCEPHIQLTPEDLEIGRRPDPRFIEAGIRVNDRLIALYGLLKPQPAGDQGPEEGVEALRAGAEAAVRALEAKIMEQNGQE